MKYLKFYLQYPKNIFINPLSPTSLKLKNAFFRVFYSLFSSKIVKLGNKKYIKVAGGLMKNVIVEKVAGKIPFLMAYSGGEMCPTQHTGGNAVNRFHNNAFVACLF